MHLYIAKLFPGGSVVGGSGTSTGGRGNNTSITNSEYILATTLSTVNALVVRDVTVHEVG